MELKKLFFICLLWTRFSCNLFVIRSVSKVPFFTINEKVRHYWCVHFVILMEKFQLHRCPERSSWNMFWWQFFISQKCFIFTGIDMFFRPYGYFLIGISCKYWQWKIYSFFKLLVYSLEMLIFGEIKKSDKLFSSSP
jgi:hypothetical protein